MLARGAGGEPKRLGETGEDGILRFAPPAPGRYTLVVEVGGVPHELIFDVSAPRGFPWGVLAAALCVLVLWAARRRRRAQTGVKDS